MNERERCDLCRLDDDACLTVCADCGRWFCRSCGDGGQCRRCLEVYAQAAASASLPYRYAKQIVFLHGLGGNPEGFTPRFLRNGGYGVTAPQLPDLDFGAAVAVANQAVAAAQPDLIVGYSRGGAVAMMLADRTTPRLLIAPALHWVEDGRGVIGPLVILHSATDDGLPLDELRQHLNRCQLSNADLRVVGDDHSMIDGEALKALSAALAELSGRQPVESPSN